MKLTVLVDNNTRSGLMSEWGLAILIEDSDKKILLDVGTSDLFIKNAKALKKDLSQLDYLVLSHGHNDHVWGIPHLLRLYKEIPVKRENRPSVVAHPLAFENKTSDDKWEIGTMLSKDEMNRNFNLKLSKDPIWLTDNLVFLGEIKRKNDFEGNKTIGKVLINNELKDDNIIDDTALAYKTSKGIVIITGCSHSGICNIVEQAKDVCNDHRVVDIVGGLHLINPSKTQLEGTLDYMKKLNPKTMHPSHCTDLKSKIALSTVTNVEEVGVGSQLEY